MAKSHIRQKGKYGSIDEQGSSTKDRDLLQDKQFVIDGTLLDGDALLGLSDLFYNYKTLKVVKTTTDKEKCKELLANKQANLEVKKQALKQCKQKARELAKYLIFLHLLDNVSDNDL